MDDLDDLYQQIIIDYSQKPRNFKVMEDADVVKDGHNPLCGDKLTLYVKEKDGIIEDVTFQGHGCAIFMASSSLLTKAVKGKTIKEAMEIFDAFHHLVTTGDASRLPEEVAKLKVMAGVSAFPVRVKCAILP